MIGEIDTLLVSFLIPNNDDDWLMIVGRREPGKDVDIVNAVRGPTVRDIHKSLVEKRKGKL